MKKLVSLFLFVFVFFTFACNQNAKFAENLSISQYQSFAISNVFGGKANPNKVDAPEITQEMFPGDSQATSVLTGENALLLSSPRPFSISMSKVNWDGNVFCSKIENGKVIDIKWDGSSISAFNYNDGYFIYLRGENNTTITAGDFYSYLITSWASSDDASLALGNTITITGDIRNLVNCLDAKNANINKKTLKSFFAYLDFMVKYSRLLNIDMTGLENLDDEYDLQGEKIINNWILWENEVYYYYTNDDCQKVLAVEKAQLKQNVAEGIYSSVPYLVAPNYDIKGAVSQIVSTFTYKKGGDVLFRDARTYYPLDDPNKPNMAYYLKSKILSNNAIDSLVIKSEKPFSISFSQDEKTWDGEIEYISLNETGEIKPTTWNGEKLEIEEAFDSIYYVLLKGIDNTTITKGNSKNHFVFEGNESIKIQGNLGCLLNYKNTDRVYVDQSAVGGLFFEQDVEYLSTLSAENISDLGLFDFYGPYSQLLSYEDSVNTFATNQGKKKVNSKIVWFEKMSDDVEYIAKIYNWQHPYGYDILSDNFLSNASYDDFSTPESLADDGKTSSCWIRDEKKERVGLVLAGEDADSIVDISICYTAAGDGKIDKYVFYFLTGKGVVQWHNLSLKNILKKFDEAIEGDWWHVIYADNLKKTITDKGKATIHVRYTAGIRDYDTSAIHVPQRFGYGGGAFKIECWDDNNIRISTNEVFYDVTGNASTSPNKLSHIGYKNMGIANVEFPLGFKAKIKYISPSVYGDSWTSDYKNSYKVVQNWSSIDKVFPKLVDRYTISNHYGSISTGTAKTATINDETVDRERVGVCFYDGISSLVNPASLAVGLL